VTHETIREIREAVTGDGAILTRAELSAASGVPLRTVTAIVRGEVRNPGIATVHRLLDAIAERRYCSRPATMDRTREAGK